VDSPFSQAKWAELEGFPNVPLLSDLGKEATQAYDVLLPEVRGMKGIAKRSAFLIDKDGNLVHKEMVENPGELPDIAGAIARMKEMA
jgi:peroxiredoxin